MNTPIYDFITEYIDSDFSRLHMPGHKGRKFIGIEERDLTEIKGADELYDAVGIIAESEKNATALFGTGSTFYSTEGSSHVIKTMLYLAVLRYRKRRKQSSKERMTVLAARNVHKSFVFACALLDLDVQWIYPENSDLSSICTCQPDARQIEKSLTELMRNGNIPVSVFITSPDYLGYEADIKSITDVIRKCCTDNGLDKNEVPLLVDNAHGAYLHFLEESRHPVDLGAYMSSDSAHKTLPVITGGAYLQMSNTACEELRSEVKNALSMFGSTSPSYLILQSLDLCNRYLDAEYREKIAETIERLNKLKKTLNNMVYGGKYIIDTEPLKLVVNAGVIGITGYELGEIIRNFKVEPEFTDVNYVVLMFAPESSGEDFERVKEALKIASENRKSACREKNKNDVQLVSLDKVMTIREAVFSPHLIVPVDEAEDRICGQTTVSCPPAIPIAVSGERITKKAIELFKAYNVTEISIVE